MELFALFSDQVPAITEGTRIAAAIDLGYETGDADKQASMTAK